jgi:hypothetical protein
MFKAEVSIPVALATSAVVVGVYAHFLPSNADARSIVPNVHLEGAERTALLTAVGVSAAISLVAKGPGPVLVRRPGRRCAVLVAPVRQLRRPVHRQAPSCPRAADDARRYQAEAIG